jgi:hypothetical protein
MPRRLARIFPGLALAAIAGLAALPCVQAQAVDKATEAMRREVEAEKRKQDAIWAKLRAMPGQDFGQVFGGVQIIHAQGLDGLEEGYVLISDHIITLNIFGSAAVRAADCRDSLSLLLATRIDQENRQRPMTAAERRTLQLAGEGDIKRFLDRVLEIRGDEGSAGVVQIEVGQYQAFLAHLRGLQTTFRSGPWGEGSLYAKALKTIRTDGLAVTR